MAVDKDLFMYDLAVASILKNEGPYVKEWLDYHLLAGVNHFFIYDNDSPDNQREVLQPYIDAGLVTYTFYPGKARQYEAYNDAFQRGKFFCRYMAWIDGDEFILPKSKPTISEVVDEVLEDKPDNVAGLTGNLHNFGSNFQEKADYTRGVLDRFVRRKSSVDRHVSTIANPRKINFFGNPHFAVYFDGCYAINENGGLVPGPFNEPGTTEKIAMHHYHAKSREEYKNKIRRGRSDAIVDDYTMQKFEMHDTNDKFDDSIVQYRNARTDELASQGSDIFQTLATNNQVDYQLLFNALANNLVPTFARYVTPPIFVNKMETFLTCRAVAAYLGQGLLDETSGKLFEETALNAVYKSLLTVESVADVQLLFSELPNILPLEYPVVKNIREACIAIIPQMMNLYRAPHPEHWREFTRLKYLMDMLKLFKD